MKLKRIILGSAMVCLVFSLAFVGTTTAAIDQSTIAPGDFMKYFMKQGSMNATSGVYNMMLNGTMWYNVTQSNVIINVNGTDYTCYVATMFANGTVWEYDDTIGSININFVENATIWLIMSDMSTILTYMQMNYSYVSPMTGYMWMGGWTWYLTPQDDYDYPISLGETWYVNYTTYSEQNQIINIPPYPYKDDWDNSTDITSEKRVAETQETIGSYSTYKIAQYEDIYSSTPSSYDWISESAASSPVMNFEEKYNADQYSYNYRIIIDGFWNGGNLDGVPIPNPQPQVSEFTLMLLPIGGIAALFIIAGRRK